MQKSTHHVIALAIQAKSIDQPNAAAKKAAADRHDPIAFGVVTT